MCCLFALGCSGERAVRKEVAIDPAQARLIETFQSLVRFIEQENPFAFMDVVSERYVPSKFSVKNDIDRGFEAYSAHIYNVEIVQVHIENGDGIVVVSWRLSRNNRTTNTFEVSTGESELHFTWEDSEWKLVQQNGDQIFGASFMVDFS